jgi:hypothetical protein
MHNHTELIKEEGVCDVGELALLLFDIGYVLAWTSGWLMMVDMRDESRGGEEGR